MNSGGVVFTNIQKFFPEVKGETHPTLSERRNIVLIADKAHRSQYDFIDGYARYMPDAPAQLFIHRIHGDVRHGTKSGKSSVYSSR